MDMAELHHTTNLASDETSPRITQRILHALKGIRYGAVEIVIHDGRIVQIERKEKVRLDVSNDRHSHR
jgi:hypothetical protein